MSVLVDGDKPNQIAELTKLGLLKQYFIKK